MQPERLQTAWMCHKRRTAETESAAQSFSRRKQPRRDRINAQLYARPLPRSFVGFLPPACFCWDCFGFRRLAFQCSSGDKCSFFNFFFFVVGVVCHTEGDMQLLGWTVVLLCQWILRKVSFSALQTNKQTNKQCLFFIARRIARLVSLETTIRHVHPRPECSFLRN